MCWYRAGPKPRMPVKAGGGAARAASEAGAGVAGDVSDESTAPLLPQPLRLKYSVGRIIGIHSTSNKYNHHSLS